MNLKVKSKKINDFTFELAISAKWEDIKNDFNIAKKKVAKEIKLPGFRKGKVPENILMTQYINSVEMGFVQDFCEKYYIMALQKEELTPINFCNPSFPLSTILYSNGLPATPSCPSTPL